MSSQNSQESFQRFSDRYPDASEDVINQYDLNAGTLKLIDEMCKGRGAIQLLAEGMGKRRSDDERFDSDKIKKMFPHLAEEEAQENIDCHDVKEALPHLAEEEDEVIRRVIEEIKTTYAHFVRLHFAYLLKSTIGEIETIKRDHRIILNYRDNTEHIRFECISLNNGLLRKLLMSIDPNDFERVITFIKDSLQLRLKKYEEDIQKQQENAINN